MLKRMLRREEVETNLKLVKGILKFSSFTGFSFKLNTISIRSILSKKRQVLGQNGKQIPQTNYQRCKFCFNGF